MPLVSSEEYECQSPSTRLNSSASRHPAAARTSTIYVHPFSFRPPSTTLFRSCSTHGNWTLACRQEVVAPARLVHASMCWVGRLGRSREEDHICGVKVCISIDTRQASFPNHTRQTQTPFGRYTQHQRAEARSHDVQGPDRGGSRWGNATKRTRLSTTSQGSTPPRGLHAIEVTGSFPRSAIEGEDRRRGKERMGGCDEGMWANGHPFIRAVVT